MKRANQGNKKSKWEGKGWVGLGRKVSLRWSWPRKWSTSKLTNHQHLDTFEHRGAPKDQRTGHFYRGIVPVSGMPASGAVTQRIVVSFKVFAEDGHSCTTTWIVPHAQCGHPKLFAYNRQVDCVYIHSIFRCPRNESLQNMAHTGRGNTRCTSLHFVARWRRTLTKWNPEGGFNVADPFRKPRYWQQVIPDGRPKLLWLRVQASINGWWFGFIGFYTFEMIWFCYKPMKFVKTNETKLVSGWWFGFWARWFCYDPTVASLSCTTLSFTISHDEPCHFHGL